MAIFVHAMQFNGYYKGEYDGAAARLYIEATPLLSGEVEVTISTFALISHPEQVYQSPTYVINGASHIVQNIQLNTSGGSGPLGPSLHWDYLLLHTQNIDDLSGVSSANDTHYGMCFTRASAVNGSSEDELTTLP